MSHISDVILAENGRPALVLSTVLEEQEIDWPALTTARVVAMLVLGLVSFALGLLPWAMVKIFKLDVEGLMQNGKNRIFISMLLCFGAGVLLCTAFVHMLPELRESVEAQVALGNLPETGHAVPLPEIFLLSGLFSVYLVEELVHLFFGRSPGHSHAARKSDLEASSDSVAVSNNSKERLARRKSSIFWRRPKLHSLFTNLSALIAVLALSFHAVFEGLAVGLESSATNVWYLMGAVAAHKFVIAFCVGVELLVSNTSFLLVVLSVGVFAIVTPLGIGIGIAVTSGESFSAETAATVVLQGMAAGTLIYVVFFEVLHRERSSLTHSGIWQFLAVLVGFLVMFGLINAAGHEHSHEDEHNHTDVHHHPHEAPTLSSILPQLVQNMTDKVVGQLTGTTPEVHGDHDHHEHHHH
ncbi:zinc transporter ZIP1-like isoform X3 [Neocloeon triangulifer]|uniref:zinc transporter ZIP1-like isoform X3 n=1 Tax=Neocloeon triangulifer TaxID=2078957 RepID=UPI00286ECDAC|nr:zinc transporter ZIP1-like isoform X3 [Neocloeon triangulifer]